MSAISLLACLPGEALAEHIDELLAVIADRDAGVREGGPQS